ncbi:hypothetical protein CBL_03127 [Carabus blaptoides fortunei]
MPPRHTGISPRNQTRTKTKATEGTKNKTQMDGCQRAKFASVERQISTYLTSGEQWNVTLETITTSHFHIMVVSQSDWFDVEIGSWKDRERLSKNGKANGGSEVVVKGLSLTRGS